MEILGSSASCTMYMIAILISWGPTIQVVKLVDITGTIVCTETML